MRQWLFGALLLSGCSSPLLTHEGRSVQVVAEAERNGCSELGEVTGQADGRSGGSWVTADELIRYATADLRNQAGARGATHVEVGPPRFLEEDGRKTVAILVGKAYACGPGTSGGYVAMGTPPSAAPDATTDVDAEVLASPTESLEEPPNRGEGEAIDRRVRAWLDAGREDVLSCVSSDRAAIRVDLSAEGSTIVALHGEGAGSPEERCVAAALGAFPLGEGFDGKPHRVIHVVRRESSPAAP